MGPDEDASMPVDRRLDGLVSRRTPQEKPWRMAALHGHTSDLSSMRDRDSESPPPGARTRARFTLAPGYLKLLDRDMRWTVGPGTLEVLAGAASENMRLRGRLEIERSQNRAAVPG